MKRSSMAVAARAALGVCVSLAAVGATAGCYQANAVTEPASSDGLRLELGDLLLSDLMVLAVGEGEPGTLLGAVSNDGDQDTEVTISLPGGDQAVTFDVDAGQTVLLGPDDQRVRFEEVPDAPGANVEILVSSTEDGEVTRRVPVLDDTFERYDELVPTPEG